MSTKTGGDTAATVTSPTHTATATTTTKGTRGSQAASRDPPKSRSALEAERLRTEAEAAARDQQDRDAAAAQAESERAKLFHLETCQPQDYLARTVYPALQEALDIIDTIRPEDPIQYLGLLLARDAEMKKTRVQQLNEIHALREGLREQYTNEYGVAGRV